MANNRVFYASHGVALCKETGTQAGIATTPTYNNTGITTGLIAVAGAQSVTMNTNFNLEQVFQLGQLEPYDNVVTDPNVEVTINKVLDGHPTIYELAVGSGSIVSNANKRTKLVMGVGSDTASTLASTRAIVCDPIYLSSVNYTIGTDGNFTEECSFVGNDKSISAAATVLPDAAAKAAQGVNKAYRRQHLNTGVCSFPTEVQGQNISSITISRNNINNNNRVVAGRVRRPHSLLLISYLDKSLYMPSFFFC